MNWWSLKTRFVHIAINLWQPVIYLFSYSIKLVITVIEVSSLYARLKHWLICYSHCEDYHWSYITVYYHLLGSNTGWFTVAIGSEGKGLAFLDDSLLPRYDLFTVTILWMYCWKRTELLLLVATMLGCVSCHISIFLMTVHSIVLWIVKYCSYMVLLSQSILNHANNDLHISIRQSSCRQKNRLQGL